MDLAERFSPLSLASDRALTAALSSMVSEQEESRGGEGGVRRGKRGEGERGEGKEERRGEREEGREGRGEEQGRIERRRGRKRAERGGGDRGKRSGEKEGVGHSEVGLKKSVR